MTSSSVFMVVARSGATTHEQIETVRSLLPSEREHLAQLLQDGRVSSAHLALDGSIVFLVVPAEDEESVRRTLREFPLYPYLDWEIHHVRKVAMPFPSADG